MECKDGVCRFKPLRGNNAVICQNKAGEWGFCTKHSSTLQAQEFKKKQEKPPQEQKKPQEKPPQEQKKQPHQEQKKTRKARKASSGTTF